MVILLTINALSFNAVIVLDKNFNDVLVENKINKKTLCILQVRLKLQRIIPYLLVGLGLSLKRMGKLLSLIFNNGSFFINKANLSWKQNISMINNLTNLTNNSLSQD